MYVFPMHLIFISSTCPMYFQCESERNVLEIKGKHAHILYIGTLRMYWKDIGNTHMAENYFDVPVSVRGFILGFSVVSVWFHHFSNFRVSSPVSDLVSVVVSVTVSDPRGGAWFQRWFQPPAGIRGFRGGFRGGFIGGFTDDLDSQGWILDWTSWGLRQDSELRSTSCSSQQIMISQVPYYQFRVISFLLPPVFPPMRPSRMDGLSFPL